jgi:hypothetical protein
VFILPDNQWIEFSSPKALGSIMFLGGTPPGAVATYAAGRDACSILYSQEYYTEAEWWRCSRLKDGMDAVKELQEYALRLREDT